MIVPAGFEPLAATIEARLADQAHGDMPRWRAALEALPTLVASRVEMTNTVTVQGTTTDAERAQLGRALAELRPWRKGPFSIFGVDIDTEWRSDWKWQRVAPHLGSLEGQRVLDVGCGNGYFGWRMLGAGARAVVGIDPTLLFCMQHQALTRYLPGACNAVLPLRLEDLDDLPQPAGFDTVFSMGVIYHRRDPAAHAARLFRQTRPGGRVVLESLVVDGDDALEPTGRYARMRNVHVVPTTGLMMRWLADAGFRSARVLDVTTTTVAEQRTTSWMRFESLAEALDPADPERTVEGHPAPRRAVVAAERV